MARKKPRFAIYDWAGNRMNWGTFKTFDDAWEYLLSKFPDDDELPQDEQNLQEYFVEQIGSDE